MSALTVATVAGAQRRRSQRQLEALAAQSVASEIEVVVVDTRPELGGIRPPEGLNARILGGDSLSFGEARALGARSAGGEIVAYLEDHCYPERGWAEALISSYRGPWASVGYAVGNANPGLRTRITHLAHYGEWERPLPGAATSLPGNNVSYRRDVLLGCGGDLPALLMADYNLHARLRRAGSPLAIEPAARVLHENETLIDGCCSAVAYSRVLAVERARLEGWGRARRLRHAATILGLGPLLRLARLVQTTGARPLRLLQIVVFSPVIVVQYLSSAVGESVGCLFGLGNGAARLMYWEVDAPRPAER